MQRHTMTEIKNDLEGINSRISEAEEWIRELEDKMLEVTSEEKNKDTETNSTITEIKNTLEGINTRISEAEEWIREVEDKMVEITSEEQTNVKRMQRTRIVSDISGTISNTPTFEL